MVQIRKATTIDVQGISEVCREANWATYGDIYSEEYLEKVIREYYSCERILDEVTTSDRSWGGYFVAIQNDIVIGAGGGGMISDISGEIYALYLNPKRRNEGIGTLLLHAITKQQKEFNAKEQWISVQKGNLKGIPFYEAKGFKLQYEEKEEGYISLRYKRLI
ncbi:GNAT family N-acetyltransferase [Metabacillus idriensis]|uniref:GNAT family N-acetyltransferase n=1 Tax=Metabacillus idriensis TaxID=324768 RepID=UPI0008A85692|nr:GNAT family N-acetyltransferase [Metabacillus idriensis]MCM3594809.1 GNAT family N-acetyltransferase [Metabacillus idriensis]OHR66210.1 acetyltransferase [Bacillus sp. HMSC76G11]